mgnify:CR=1 FL=1
MLHRNRHLQRRHAAKLLVSNLGLDLRLLEESRHNFGPAFVCGHVQRGKSATVHAIDVCMSLQELADDPLVSLLRGSHERAKPVLRHLIDTRPMVQQQRHYCCVASMRCHVQRGPSSRTHIVHIELRVLQQHPDRLDVAVVGGDEECRVFG